MRPRERYGTRYLGMSPRGGIAGPHELHYSETGAGCQCARRLCRNRDGRFQHAYIAAAGASFLLAVPGLARMIGVLSLQLIAR